MPTCSLCNHELEGHICNDCAEAMAVDILTLKSKVEELEREMNFANQELKLLIELLPKVTL